MSSEQIKKIGIMFLLGSLMVSAFFIRLENFKNSPARSIDEIVFYRMALQVHEEGLSGYNTIPYGKDLSAQGRHLYQYFFEPLFKHPPVFTLMIAGVFHLLGTKLFVAGMIPILLSAMMIPLVYWLGKMIVDRRVGVFAALLLWMDPISIICSQKVWLDTAIAFFTLLSVCFFVWALREKRDAGFILSGLAAGLAVNTKYSGILVIFAYFLFACFYQRQLFKKPVFLMGLLCPFVLLLPWFFWNLFVYQDDVIKVQGELHTGFMLLINQIAGSGIFLSVGCLLTVILMIVIVRFQRSTSANETLDNVKGTSGLFRWSYVFVGITILLILSENIKNSLNPIHIPTHSWSSGLFHGVPGYFYFGRLVEYSFLYIFGFLAFLTYFPSEKPLRPVLRLSMLVMFVFFILWGNYQSRYILSVIPFLLIFTAELIINIFNYLRDFPYPPVRVIAKAGMVILVSYALYRTYFINMVLSFPNDLCYF